MRLTIVGCSGSYPGPESAASCYLVQANDDRGRTWSILLDLGSGALGPLQRYIDLLKIDAVFFSHLHPDHCSDLNGFWVVRNYGPKGHQPPIPVYGPAGVADRAALSYGLPLDPGMRGEFDFHEYRGAITLGPFKINPVPVHHPIPAYGLRVQVGDSVLAYTGDTDICPALTILAQDADLLLAEAAYLDSENNPTGVHMTGSQAVAVARDANAEYLVLTHLPPWCEQSRHLTDALTMGGCEDQIDLAKTGATYDIGD